MPACEIGVIDPDTSLFSIITCANRGGLSGVGKVLNEHYDSRSLAEELIGQGCLSYLCPRMIQDEHGISYFSNVRDEHGLMQVLSIDPINLYNIPFRFDPELTHSYVFEGRQWWVRRRSSNPNDLMYRPLSVALNPHESGFSGSDCYSWRAGDIINYGDGFRVRFVRHTPESEIRPIVSDSDIPYYRCFEGEALSGNFGASKTWCTDADIVGVTRRQNITSRTEYVEEGEEI